MKRILCIAALLLVFAMAANVVWAADIFTDDNDIVNTEAASMLTSLGVIAGFPDGKFRPADDVTRGQLAKMIFYIKNGIVDKSADNAASYSGSELKDMEGHWAKGYVYYCYKNGIIAGYVDSTFRPDRNVTAAEAAKMLLVALGYDSARYVGAGWMENTIEDAKTAGITDGYPADMSSTLDRDNAALFMLNALFATVADSGGETALLQSCYGIQKTTVTVIANKWAAIEGSASEAGYTMVQNNDTGERFLIAEDTSIRDLGRTFCVYLSGRTSQDAFTVYGGFFRPKTERVVADTSKSVAPADVVGRDNAFAGYASDARYLNNYATRIEKSSFLSLTAQNPGNRVIYISVNGDAYVDTVIYLSGRVVQLEQADEDTVTFAGSASAIKRELIDTEETLKAGEFYTVFSVGKSYLLEKAEKQTGTLTQCSAGVATLNGTLSYELSVNAAAISVLDGSTVPASVLAQKSFEGKSVTFITDCDDHIVAVYSMGQAEQKMKYALVLSSARVAMVKDSLKFFGEDTNGVIAVTNDGAYAFVPYEEGLYTYGAVNSDGTVYQLDKTGIRPTAGTKIAIATGQSAIYGLNGTATEDTLFFFWSGVDGEEPTLYRGIGSVPSVNAAADEVWYCAQEDKLEAVYIRQSDPGITSGRGYIYILNNQPVEWSQSAVAGQNTYTYEGWSNGKLIRLSTHQSSIGTGLYAYSTADGITGISPVDTEHCVQSKINGVYSGFIFLEGEVSPNSIHNWKGAELYSVNTAAGTLSAVTQLSDRVDVVVIYNRTEDNTADAVYVFFGDGVTLGR